VRVSTASSADRVTLTVADTGPGVPQQRIHSIFEPFFTTKEPGRGTGLGLKICSDVISQHKGHIEVENQAGAGAVFRVVLPRADESQISGLRPSSMRADARTSSRPQRSILIVDDDVVLARTLKRALKPHAVTTVHTLADALERLDESEPDVILCDMFLPDGSGAELHARVAAERPRFATRFLFLTGGGLSAQDAAYLRASGCTTLTKPVQTAELADRLERVTSSGPPPRGLPTLSLMPGARR
jgi:CheY-like chemotaxis protein